MFLIQDRAEILAETGRGIGYSTRVMYEVGKWRDEQKGVVRTVTTQLVMTALIPVSIIESVVRAPLSLLIAAFSSESSKWHQGMSLSILTPLYATYATMLNLFVQSVCSQVVYLDMNLKMWQQDHLLFAACEAGRADLAKHLLESGASPHKIIRANATSALVPRMLGHLDLEHLFEHDDYEKEFIKLRVISQWLGLAGTVDLHGESIRLDASPSPWMFDELAEALQRFRTDDDFNQLMLPYRSAERIQDALFSAYSHKSSSAIAKRIRDGSLTFLASGWKGHAICVSFYKGYLAISNRGEGSDQTGTLKVFKIDPQKVSSKVVDEILMHQVLDQSKGMTYFYEKLPVLLSSSGKVKQDTLCTHLEKIAPPASESGTCALDSKIGAVRFAWAMELSDPIVPEVFERAALESDLFVSWAGAKCLDNERFRDLFPNVKPKELLFAQAKRNWRAKCAEYRNIRSRLGLGIIWGYM